MSVFVSIDENGTFHSGGQKWSDESVCKELMRNLQLPAGSGYVSSYQGQMIFVEAFDHPIVAKDLDVIGQEVLAPYDVSFPISIASLQLDEWDRITGLTNNGIRYVLNRQAQMDLFDQFDEFDDMSYVANGVQYLFGKWPTHPATSQSNKSTFWGEKYVNEEMGWDLGGPHPSLLPTIQQLKLPRSRILVLGCGRGHDAAQFALQGHIVTAVDFSKEAIEKAKILYESVPQLRFEVADALRLPQSYDGSFDLIFEHTLYCALPPGSRNDLVKSWKRVLHDQGHLLGIFPVFEREDGPPYSSTEWELRERMKKNWQPLYWNRSRITPPKRVGQEVIIYSRLIKS